jgi:hypothetical protein
MPADPFVACMPPVETGLNGQTHRADGDTARARASQFYTFAPIT